MYMRAIKHLRQHGNRLETLWPENKTRIGFKLTRNAEQQYTSNGLSIV